MTATATGAFMVHIYRYKICIHQPTYRSLKDAGCKGSPNDKLQD